MLIFIFISFVIAINAAITTILSHDILKLLSGTSSSFPGSNKVFYAYMWLCGTKLSNFQNEQTNKRTNKRTNFT